MHDFLYFLHLLSFMFITKLETRSKFSLSDWNAMFLSSLSHFLSWHAIDSFFGGWYSGTKCLIFLGFIALFYTHLLEVGNDLCYNMCIYMYVFHICSFCSISNLFKFDLVCYIYSIISSLQQFFLFFSIPYNYIYVNFGSHFAQLLS